MSFKKTYHKFIKDFFKKYCLCLMGVLFFSCISLHSASVGRGIDFIQKDSFSLKQERGFNYFYLESLRLKGENKYDDAFEMLFHALSMKPNSSAALFEMGQYYLTLGQIHQAIKVFKGAVENEPTNYWYNQTLANLYLQQNDSINAVDAFKQMVIRFPKRKEPLLSLIDLYTQQKNYAAVIQILNQLEKVIGNDEEIDMDRFRTYLQMNDNKRALKEIERLVKAHPLDYRYQVVLGDIYLQDNKKSKAYNIYKKVLDLDPNNSMALYSMANYYKATNQAERYEQQLDTLLLNKGVLSDTKVEIMKQLITQYEGENRDSTQILVLFDKIIKEDPDDVQIPMLYANYLIAKGLNDKSLPVLEHIVQLDPTNVAARLMLLSAAIKKEDYKKVIQICEPGIEATPDALELYFYLAIAYNQANRTDDALAVSRKALTHVKNDSKKEVVSDFYAMIGDLLHTKALNKDAYAAYDSALVYNADNVGALNNYAYYLSVEHQHLDKAEEMSYKTVKAEPNNSTFLDTYAWILFIKGKYTQALIYIDNAMKNGGESSDVVTEHCGDIHAMNGDMEGALKYWIKSKNMGNKSKTLQQKIIRKKYISE